MSEEFIKITELIGEMAWGIDLPSPMTAYFQELQNPHTGEIIEPQKIYAVDPKNYKPVFEAIYQKLKNNPDYSPLKEERERGYKLQSEIQSLQYKLKAYEDVIYVADKGINKWLSASLEDPSVCGSMKEDVNLYFEALSKLENPDE